MDILESLKRNATRKSDLDADKELLLRSVAEIERLRKTVAKWERLRKAIPRLKDEYAKLKN